VTQNTHTRGTQRRSTVIYCSTSGAPSLPLLAPDTSAVLLADSRLRARSLWPVTITGLCQKSSHLLLDLLFCGIRKFDTYSSWKMNTTITNVIYKYKSCTATLTT